MYNLNFRDRNFGSLFVILSVLAAPHFSIAQCGYPITQLEPTHPVLGQRGLLATQAACLRPQDEIWLVSTRALDDCSIQPSDLRVDRLENGVWKTESFEALSACHQNETDKTTTFYVHGNLTDYDYSIVRGLQFYHNVFPSTSHTSCTAPPVRFVIWSWESERQLSWIVSDALLKSKRAIDEGRKFRSAIDALPGERPLLIGYSFGGQVVTSALYTASSAWGGEKYSATLIAPAFDRDFIHQFCPEQLEDSADLIRSFVNGKDRAVKAGSSVCRRRYRRSGRCDYRVSSKLGCSSILDEIDISCSSGKKHSIDLYSQNGLVIEGVKQLLQSKKSIAKTPERIAMLEASVQKSGQPIEIIGVLTVCD